MWLGVRHTHKEALNIFSREIAPAGTGMGEECICWNIYYCKCHVFMRQTRVFNTARISEDTCCVELLHTCRESLGGWSPFMG